MAKKTAKAKKDLTVRPRRAKLSAAEIIQRMESLPERGEKIIKRVQSGRRFHRE